jgi:dihydroflavonol-4-reductase
MPRVLITGATGFIGPHLAEHLLRGGDHVVCLRRRTSDVSRLSGLDVELAQGDLTDADSLRAVLDDVQVVYHLAGAIKALRSQDFFRINEGGTRCLLEACAARPTPPVVVLVSSLAAAGPSWPDRPRAEADPPQPVSHYGQSKRAAEQVCRQFAATVPVTIVRPPIVFGEADPATLQLFRPIARSGWHVVPGWRDARFSLVHAADLCAALRLAAQRGARLLPASAASERHDDAAQGVYFAAFDEHPTYAELGQRIGAALGRRKTRIVRVARWTVRFAALCSEIAARVRRQPGIFNLDKAREAVAGSWTCSPQKAMAELGWRPAATLDERLAQTAQWYRTHGWL